MSGILRALLGLTRLRVTRTLVSCFISQTKVQQWAIAKDNNNEQKINYSWWAREWGHWLLIIRWGDRLVSIGKLTNKTIDEQDTMITNNLCKWRTISFGTAIVVNGRTRMRVKWPDGRWVHDGSAVITRYGDEDNDDNNTNNNKSSSFLFTVFIFGNVS